MMNTEKDFIILYLEDIVRIYKLPRQYARITAALLRHVSKKDGMCLILVPSVKRAICEELGYERMTSLNNALHRLFQRGIVYRIERGVYKFNPDIFDDGDVTKINNFKLTIDYDMQNGRTYKACAET